MTTEEQEIYNRESTPRPEAAGKPRLVVIEADDDSEFDVAINMQSSKGYRLSHFSTCPMPGEPGRDGWAAYTRYSGVMELEVAK